MSNDTTTQTWLRRAATARPSARRIRLVTDRDIVTGVRAWALFWSGWFLARVMESPTALNAIGLALNVLLAAMARDRSDSDGEWARRPRVALRMDPVRIEIRREENDA